MKYGYARGTAEQIKSQSAICFRREFKRSSVTAGSDHKKTERDIVRLWASLKRVISSR